jgi:polyhydroxybutyrate depolymerase
MGFAMRAHRVAAFAAWLGAVACGGGAASSVAVPNASADPGTAMQPVDMLPSTAAGAGGVATGSAAAGSGSTRSASAGSSASSSGGTSAAGAGGTLSAAGASGTSAAAGAPGPMIAAGRPAAVGGSPAAGSGAEMQTCPAKNGYDAGTNSVMIMHSGRSRHFSVHMSTAITAGTAVPLVLDFHGNGSSGSQEESSSGWRAKADKEGFVVAFPDGVGNGWNVGNCCGESLKNMVDDVGFAREVVKTISANVCIDAKRVYATGLSNGAGLTHRIACEAADVFAAVAAASADLVTDPCKPARPISELSVRGLSDTAVAYEGGNTGSTGWYSPGAKGTLMLWKDIDGCTGEPDTSKQYCETYSQCQGGVEVTLCSLPGTGHVLYQNSLGFNVPDEAWAMFMRQPMK